MISFEQVAYSYGGGELLSDISLRLAPGSFHFLTGPSGSGKSTFLKLCYAELLPTAGRVMLFDREVRGLSREGTPGLRWVFGFENKISCNKYICSGFY